MANTKSKLLATSKNPSCVFLTIFIFLVLLINSVKSDSLSFNLPSFEPSNRNIVTINDAKISGGVLELTKKDQYGNPVPHNVGLSIFIGVVHLSDKKSGKVADFSTEFSFVVNPKGTIPHGDGFTFFLSSLDFEFPVNSSGGFLGLFNEETAFKTLKNQVVAVEFDSFANEWDPNFPESDSPHIGIDINSIKSVATVAWPSDSQPQGEIGVARISYDSAYKILSVSVSYPRSPVTVLSHPVDFAAVLSERVLIGFSGTTGEVVETHDILSWSFASSL
ncbi:hypothetical protein RJT34_06458 [Clitoria ternatea]|uniref:Legume lectin domain-containing protein n=1 Tax=Clitoria ternatea TaxID=43366 RepID=A0AAN9K4A4_CLITE